MITLVLASFADVTSFLRHGDSNQENQDSSGIQEHAGLMPDSENTHTHNIEHKIIKQNST